jgi:hypothetical protein
MHAGPSPRVVDPTDGTANETAAVGRLDEVVTLVGEAGRVEVAVAIPAGDGADETCVAAGLEVFLQPQTRTAAAATQLRRQSHMESIVGGRDRQR